MSKRDEKKEHESGFFEQDSLVIWLGASVMSIAVDQECVVQCVQVSEDEANMISVGQSLAPQIPWQYGRQ